MFSGVDEKCKVKPYSMKAVLGCTVFVKAEGATTITAGDVKGSFKKQQNRKQVTISAQTLRSLL